MLYGWLVYFGTPHAKLNVSFVKLLPSHTRLLPSAIHLKGKRTELFAEFTEPEALWPKLQTSRAKLLLLAVHFC
jgi:hypothetical protein